MLFTSYEFLCFIAVLLIAYYLVPKKYQWQLLLVASYLFYIVAGVECVVYILATTVTTYFAAIKVEQNLDRQNGYLKEYKTALSKEEKHAYKDRQKKIRIRWVLVCVLFNIAILAAVKCGNFNSLIIPMGISFYTLQSLGYLIDVYRGTVTAEKSLLKFALFISFFPQLIQGPISRYGDLEKTLYLEHPFDSKTVSYGLQRILWGYFKKLVIADRILAGVSTIVSDTNTYYGAYIFVGMLFYTLELYTDFTGGIDITIGIAETMGISLQENFNCPYFSESLKEYWRRWHISMCSWFRDYVFYPVSICKPMQKFSKYMRKHFGETVGRRVPMYFSSFMVWMATGIWHGVNWNFIVWGLANWFILMISEELEPVYARFHKCFQSRFCLKQMVVYKIFQMVRTFMLVCCLNLFDCYSSLAVTLRMFVSIFTVHNWEILWDKSLMTLGLTILDYIILVAGIAVLLLASLLQRSGNVRDRISKYAYPVRFMIWYGLFLVVLLMGAYGIGYDASQFIYNQF